jgi:hypothetical protein
MIKALQHLKIEPYVPYSERDNATPTRFMLRPLDGIERLDVSFFRDDLGNLSLSSAAARAALKYGLQGWENLMDEAGSPVPFSPVDRDANMKRLPAELVAELATEIFVRSVLSEQERKNSSSLPTSRPSSGAPSSAANASGDAIATNPTPPATSSGSSPGS